MLLVRKQCCNLKILLENSNSRSFETKSNAAYFGCLMKFCIACVSVLLLSCLLILCCGYAHLTFFHFRMRAFLNEGSLDDFVVVVVVKITHFFAHSATVKQLIAVVVKSWTSVAEIVLECSRCIHSSQPLKISSI